MKFIDHTLIEVHSGKGGDGIATFRRAANKPKLGCDGGDGGHGGHVIMVGCRQLNTLSSFRYKQTYKAARGENGGTNCKTGAAGENLYLKVPLGTLVIDNENNQTLGEILNDGDELVICEGGKKGVGNQHFVSSTHQAPEECTKGGPAIEKFLRLELKLMADIGLAGFPNAGKSTLQSKLSAAKPKIADYPFTTLTPNLGVVDLYERTGTYNRSFVLADIPGLVEGASEGRGLGHEFLKHLERTKCILYVVDLVRVGEEDVSPYERFLKLQKELSGYDQKLVEKPSLIALNKSDLIDDSAELEEIADEFRKHGYETMLISAATGQGLTPLCERLYDLKVLYDTEELEVSSHDYHEVKISSLPSGNVEELGLGI